MDNHRGEPKLLDPGARRNTCELGQRLHPPDAGGGRCRVRIYLPEEEQDAPVVICSELPNNGGASVTYAAEQLAAEVIRYNRLPTPLVGIEYWPKEAMDGEEESFELVVFSSYKVEERAPYLGETRAWIGDATWKRLDRLAWWSWWEVRCRLAKPLSHRDGFLRNPLSQARWRESAAPGIIRTANRALSHEVSRDTRILAMRQIGVDKRQTPNPGEK